MISAKCHLTWMSCDENPSNLEKSTKSTWNFCRNMHSNYVFLYFCVNFYLPKRDIIKINHEMFNNVAKANKDSMQISVELMVTDLSLFKTISLAQFTFEEPFLDSSTNDIDTKRQCSRHIFQYSHCFTFKK